MADEKGNTGYRNTGNLNTGNLNTGDLNTGNLNTGDLNTGYLNTGNLNTGNLNTGNLNTGDLNTGNLNTGNRNTGYRNTGNLNTGNLNTGNLNTGNRNTGYLNTGDAPVTFFDVVVPGLSWDDAVNLIPWVDLPSFSCEWIEVKDMIDSEKSAAPSHKTTGGFLRKYSLTIQQSFPRGWAKLSIDDKKRFAALPNFDADKFLICTGVDVRLDKDLNTQPAVVTASNTETVVVDNFDEITLKGVRYKLVPVA